MKCVTYLALTVMVTQVVNCCAGCRQRGPHPPRLYCDTNLSTLGTGIAIYKAEHHDQYPPDLNAIVQAGTSAQVLRCPDAKSNRTCDYFFLPPAANAPGTALIVCDLAGNHPDGRNCLRAWCSVDCLTTEQFQAELAKPENAAFAAGLKAAGG